jgi:hypothetical protein
MKTLFIEYKYIAPKKEFHATKCYAISSSTKRRHRAVANSDPGIGFPFNLVIAIAPPNPQKKAIRMS